MSSSSPRPPPREGSSVGDPQKTPTKRPSSGKVISRRASVASLIDVAGGSFSPYRYPSLPGSAVLKPSPLPSLPDPSKRSGAPPPPSLPRSPFPTPVEPLYGNAVSSHQSVVPDSQPPSFPELSRDDISTADSDMSYQDEASGPDTRLKAFVFQKVQGLSASQRDRILSMGEEMTELLKLAADARVTKPLPHSHPRVPTRTFTPVTREEVLDTLSECASDNAPGISGLTYRVWKWVALTAPDALVSVVQSSISLGIHHDSWKQSLVAVIPKNNKKDMSLPKSHRPIQLIECLGKLVEKIMARRLTFDLGKFNLMPFNQFGGRSNSSCLDAGLSLCHDVQEAHLRGLVSSFLAVDIKGFFDHVDHKRLLEVLEHKGFPIEYVNWVRSFTSDRFVRVQVDDHVGRPHPQFVGLPQGSPISPVLACLFTACLLEILNSDPIFCEPDPLSLPVGPRGYVDDFGFHAIACDLETSTHILKLTLKRAVDILDCLGLSIDPDKCDLIHFTWRHHSIFPSISTTLYGNPLIISQKPVIRWLGFHLDRKLSFNHHVSLLSTRARRSSKVFAFLETPSRAFPLPTSDSFTKPWSYRPSLTVLNYGSTRTIPASAWSANWNKYNVPPSSSFPAASTTHLRRPCSFSHTFLPSRRLWLNFIGRPLFVSLDFRLFPRSSNVFRHLTSNVMSTSTFGSFRQSTSLFHDLLPLRTRTGSSLLSTFWSTRLHPVRRRRSRFTLTTPLPRSNSPPILSLVDSPSIPSPAIRPIVRV